MLGSLFLARIRIRLLLAAQNFADGAIDAGCILGGIVCEFDPFRPDTCQLCLTQEIAGLHGGLDRIAEIVRQGGQAASHIRWQVARTLYCGRQSWRTCYSIPRAAYFAVAYAFFSFIVYAASR